MPSAKNTRDARYRLGPDPAPGTRTGQDAHGTVRQDRTQGTARQRGGGTAVNAWGWAFCAPTIVLAVFNPVEVFIGFVFLVVGLLVVNWAIGKP